MTQINVWSGDVQLPPTCRVVREDLRPGCRVWRFGVAAGEVDGLSEHFERRFRSAGYDVYLQDSNPSRGFVLLVESEVTAGQVSGVCVDGSVRLDIELINDAELPRVAVASDGWVSLANVRLRVPETSIGGPVVDDESLVSASVVVPNRTVDEVVEFFRRESFAPLKPQRESVGDPPACLYFVVKAHDVEIVLEDEGSNVSVTINVADPGFSQD